jgi:aryl-alcohol dehydrogenase-like predicted oxidoreductase
MRYRQLGHGGLLVSELALGTVIFGEDSQRSTAPKEAERIIQRFLNADGIHMIRPMSMLMGVRKR